MKMIVVEWNQREWVWIGVNESTTFASWIQDIRR